MSSDRISRAASAAEQLCAVLWETVREQVDAGEAREASELSRRLVEVCESFSAVADLAAQASDEQAGAGAPPSMLDATTRPGSAASRSDAPVLAFEAQGGSPGGERSEHRPGARAFDEPRGEPEGGGAGAAAEDARAANAAAYDARAANAAADDARFTDAAGEDAGAAADRRRRFAGASVSLVDELEEESEQIEVKDVRADGHPPVSAAVQRRLDRHALDGSPFSLLLVEVLDVERLRALRTGGDLLREIWAVESAIAEQLRPADTLLREIDGRWWLLAPDTGAVGALELAEKLAAAARRFAHRGAPLRVVIGIAVCPEHGLDPAALIGHADVDLYAAQAAGRSIGGGFDDDPQPA